MDKFEYLMKLNHGLSKMPEDERKNAVRYYEEYFTEAGPEQEQKIIEELGPPKKLAAKIMADFAIKDYDAADTQNKAKKGVSTIWMVIAAIFASPIALPIAIAVAIVAIVLIITVFVIFASLLIVSICFTLCAVAFIILSVWSVFQSIPTSVFFFGIALALAGLGILLGVFSIWITRLSINLLVKFVTRILSKKEAGKDEK